MKASKAVQYEGEVFEVYLQGDGGLHSADMLKNHCINVLIKLNNPQCILYKTCLRNLFFFKFRIKEEHFVQTRLSPISSDWLVLFSLESKFRKV